MTNTYCIVFIHLGDNPSINLISNAKCVIAYNPNALLFLLTNRPLDWQSFPGKVIEVSDYQVKMYSKFKTIFSFRDKFTVAGGYWIHTLTRLFCLEIMESLIPDNLSIYHIESDVQFYMNQKIHSEIAKSGLEAACCRLTEDLGIGTVLYFKNKYILMDKLSQLRNIVSASKNWISDMQLLGIALNRNILAELPSKCNDLKLRVDSRQFIFDPAPAGQYLFGQDPVLQDNNLYGGYLSPDRFFEFNKVKWKIENLFDDQYSYISIEDKRKYFLLNLHLHSKINIIPPSEKVKIWRETIDAANRLIAFPLLMTDVKNQIHSNDGPLLGRIIRRLRNIYNRLVHK